METSNIQKKRKIRKWQRRTGNKQDHTETTGKKGGKPPQTKHATHFEFYNLLIKRQSSEDIQSFT